MPPRGNAIASFHQEFEIAQIADRDRNPALAPSVRVRFGQLNVLSDV